MSDWSDKSDWSDLSAAFAADTTIVGMRVPLPHGKAAADLTSVSKQTNAPPQMSGVASRRRGNDYYSEKLKMSLCLFIFKRQIHTSGNP